MGIGEVAKVDVASKARPWLVTSIAAISWSLVTMIVLHIVSSHNPILDTLSSYAFTNRGSGMLGASMLAMAIGSLAILGALTAAGLSLSRNTVILFSAWALGLAVAAIFPASYAQNPDPLSGEIHQYSCVIAFLSLPVAGYSLIDRLREFSQFSRDRATLIKLTWASAGSVGLFGTSYVLAALQDNPVIGEIAVMLPVGFTQRLALASDLILLAWLILFAARVASRSTSEISETANGNRTEPWLPVGTDLSGTAQIRLGNVQDGQRAKPANLNRIQEKQLAEQPCVVK